MTCSLAALCTRALYVALEYIKRATRKVLSGNPDYKETPSLLPTSPLYDGEKQKQRRAQLAKSPILDHLNGRSIRAGLTRELRHVVHLGL